MISTWGKDMLFMNYRLFFCCLCWLNICALGLGSAAKDVPRTFSFATKDELFQSKYWKELFKQRDIKTLRNNVIHIRDLDSIIYIRESNAANSRLKKPALSVLSKLHLHKNYLELTEVQYGDGESDTIEGTPVSSCVSSELSSGGATYAHSYQYLQGLTLSLGPEISLEAAQLGVTLTENNDGLSLTYSSTGSITCTAPDNGRVQVFASMKYKFFPKARKREMVFYRGDTDFHAGAWSMITSEDETFKGKGAAFFDLKSIPFHECVTEEDLLQCDKYKSISKIHQPSMVPEGANSTTPRLHL